MDQKKLGIILIILGLVLAGIVQYIKYNEEQHIDIMVQALGGTCFLEDGTCLHSDRNMLPYYSGFGIALAMVLFGVYIGFIDTTQREMLQHQQTISHALKEAKMSEKEKDEFRAFLSGFNEHEQKVLKAIHTQEGIKQSTLRFKTGMSKAKLSLMLKELEKQDIITRKPSGKTNALFLRKKY